MKAPANGWTFHTKKKLPALSLVAATVLDSVLLGTSIYVERYSNRIDP
jgi:hypothetical protein